MNKEEKRILELTRTLISNSEIGLEMIKQFTEDDYIIDTENSYFKTIKALETIKELKSLLENKSEFDIEIDNKYKHQKFNF